MATIKYNGMELEEVTTPQIFDKPKKMLVWNNIMDYAIQSMIVAIVERMDGLCAMCYDGETYPHCAEIPEESKLRRATNRELSRWLAQGNGEFTNPEATSYNNFSSFAYEECEKDKEVYASFKVRKWDDTEWHTPDAEYMGITEVKTYEDVVKREG